MPLSARAEEERRRAVFYWFLKRFLLGPWLKVLFRPWIEGEENIPTDGPALLVSNHLSFSDSIFLPLVLKRRATFLAKSDYFTGTGPKGMLSRLFFGGTGQVPIDRSGGKASEAALNTGLRILGQGDLLALYPEGTRSHDGHLFRGRTGAARMALHAEVPVIPVAMIGTFEAQPTGQIKPQLRRIGVRIGAPIDFSRYYGMAEDRFVLRSATDEMMYDLMQLSGQTYQDTYATVAKQQAKEARAQERETAGEA
ncbi:MAG: lysophospholipid acyltransferase family protein [Candidatus Nanopelagicales bacterium]